MSVVFDKLSFVKRLEDAGNFSRPQAEALSDAFHQAVSETVATKQDVVAVGLTLAAVRAEVKSDIESTRNSLKQDLEGIRFSQQAEVANLHTAIAEAKVWTVSVGATIIAVLAAMKYFG